MTLTWKKERLLETGNNIWPNAKKDKIRVLPHTTDNLYKHKFSRLIKNLYIKKRNYKMFSKYINENLLDFGTEEDCLNKTQKHLTTKMIDTFVLKV